jgi:hypothetical protein
MGTIERREEQGIDRHQRPRGRWKAKKKKNREAYLTKVKVNREPKSGQKAVYTGF